MRLFLRPKKVLILIAVVFLVVWLFATFIDVFLLGFISGRNIFPSGIQISPQRELKAFITSAYYYPASKSLGNNSLALVMSINLVNGQHDYFGMKLGDANAPSEISIMAENSTTRVKFSTGYVRVTPHEVCQMITIFCTVQLLPNTKSISMVGDNQMVEIPFQIPSYTKRDVVVCTSPLFVSEQWQNFLFAAHIYRKFGAHMNLYLISSVSSFYQLMKEYEKENYVTIQPWVGVYFPDVPLNIADPVRQTEFRNQAASQTDCLLQFKESASFITFLDLDDVLIPRIAPTYFEEFQKIMSEKNNLAYIFYHKENYDATTTRHGSLFSLKSFFESLEVKHVRETGKIVVDPKNLNYTWIHFPPFLPNGKEKYEVTENVITHLKTIIWSDSAPSKSKILREPFYFDNSTSKLLSSKAILEIEADLRKMMKKPKLRRIFATLPTNHPYTDLVVNCYNDRYYRYHYSGRIGEIKCPGPQLCGFYQNPKIKCTHSTASYIPMETMEPITFYYATNRHFTDDIGCFAF